LIPILIRVAVELGDSATRKYPDAHLVNLETTYPLIAMEVGFTETLDDLFDDAEKYLHGCEGKVQLVIIMKIHQDRATEPRVEDYPWGLGDEAARSKPSALVGPVVDWYRRHEKPLVRPMTAFVYLYSYDMTRRPRRPIWTYNFAVGQPLHEGVKTKCLNRGLFLGRDLDLKILGTEIPFPWSRLERKLHEAIQTQERLRALRLVNDVRKVHCDS
jgi:hypothetical protein